MKIAFLSFYNGKIDRGVEVAVLALAEGLGKNHPVKIFQAGERIHKSVPTVKIPIEQKWPADTSNHWLRKFFLDYYSVKILWFTIRCLPQLWKEKFDVVIPTNGGWQVILIRFLTWLQHKKMIVQGNAGIGRDDFWGLLWLPDHFIAISPQGFAWSKKKAPWVSQSYIPYGVSIENIRQVTPHHVALKKPIVLCVSAFLPYKQVQLLISAMELVPHASLLVIGHGPLEESLRTVGTALLGDRFLLLTGVTHDQLAGYYKAADVFSLPSKSSEAFGIVYIEAMAAGLTIVAPNDYNRRKLIGDGGIFVEPENRDAYAEALKKALATKKNHEMQKQVELFSWPRIIEQYERLLAKTL